MRHGPQSFHPQPRPHWSPHPTLREIFAGGFLGLGLISFGGALPLARRAIVEQRRWLSAEEFTDLLGLCQFLPGGNIINLSVAIGLHFRGVRGALAGLLGLIAGPSLVVIGLGVLYEHTQNDPHVRHLFAGLAAAAAGLLISMAVKIVLPLRNRPLAALIAALGFVAIAILRLPLLPTMLVLAPLSDLLRGEERTMNDTLVSLAAIFSQLSLLASGGGNSDSSGRCNVGKVVDVHHWMPASEFSALFAPRASCAGAEPDDRDTDRLACGRLGGNAGDVGGEVRTVVARDDHRAACVGPLQGPSVATVRANWV